MPSLDDDVSAEDLVSSLRGMMAIRTLPESGRGCDVVGMMGGTEAMESLTAKAAAGGGVGLLMELGLGPLIGPRVGGAGGDRFGMGGEGFG